MAKKGSKKESKLAYELIAGIVFILIACFSYYNNNISTNSIENDIADNTIIENSVINPITADEMENIELSEGEKIQIHFFDVGQADSILLISDNKTMLIDAGTNDTGKKVVQNIKKLGVDKIDYLIGTHPHEDHIGGLDDVIKAFEIGTIYMPKIQANTKTFEDVLDVISDKGLKVTKPNVRRYL